MRISQGFTLIELMIGVAIIAILSAIALPAYQYHVAKGQLVSALADINGGRSMYEAKLVAEDISSFDPADIGLGASSPRCSAIALVSGVTGHIECVVRGNPLVNGTIVRLSRTSSGVWSCSAGTTVPAAVKPAHCI